MTEKQKQPGEVDAKAANSEADRQAMSTAMQASFAAQEAERMQEERRRVAAEVQNDAASKAGTETVYKKDSK